jgi:hypothetical protein
VRRTTEPPMIRKRKPGEPAPVRKQIGCKLDSELWREVKILALKQGRTAGELLEDAMREYLLTHGEF